MSASLGFKKYFNLIDEIYGDKNMKKFNWG